MRIKTLIAKIVSDKKKATPGERHFAFTTKDLSTLMRMYDKECRQNVVPSRVSTTLFKLLSSGVLKSYTMESYLIPIQGETGYYMEYKINIEIS